ncbi:hypothetical protein AWI30_22360 [Enterobacter hormaechei subsp. oharae]|nr:hypothetical protein AWI30_22360 [Enterobacter hormaechei subsp. oharae]
MTHHLKSRDIIALGFMTFALFVGAGNIIFPPMVGLQAGEHVWTAAFGFLLTACGCGVEYVEIFAIPDGTIQRKICSISAGYAPVLAWRRIVFRFTTQIQSV